MILVASLLFELVRALVYPGITFIIAYSLTLEWIDRKVYAHAQHRIGPYYVGPSGFLQPFADLLKLLSKEDITPPHVDKLLYTISPPLLLYIALLATYAIPTGAWGDPRAIINFEGDYLLVLALTSILTAFIFLGSWGSFNRFGAIGSVRALLLLVGYEIPMFICAAAVALDSGTLCLSRIAELQAKDVWFVLKHPLGFIIFIITAQAELERIPFDIPEAETEIVAGWLTEFSGKKLAMLHLASDIRLFLMSALIATLYLGGPWGPGGSNILWFLLKTTFVCFLTSVIRALFARYRIDQAEAFFWKYIIPLSLLQMGLSILILKPIGW